MKKNYLLLLFALFIFKAASSQNCNFTVQTNPGTTAVAFIPNQTFLQWNYHYIWNFGDGTTDSTAFPTHVYNSMGPFVACYDVYDSINNWICNSCDTIYFGTPTLCSFTYTNTGMVFTFNASGVNGPVSWDFGDGSSDTGHVVTHTYAFGGQYTVIMTEYTSSHNINCQGWQNITAPGTTNCSFTASSSGNTGSFYINNPSAVQSVTWDFGDNTAGSGIQATHTYNSNGMFTVCATIVDTMGYSCHSCQAVAINLSNNCYFNYAPDTTTLTTYFFTAVPANPMNTITWDFGDGTTATGSNPTHSFPAPGTYYVCMNENSGSALYCQSCLYVTVYNPNSCNFTYSANQINPLAINFQATGNSAVAWDFGDGSPIDTGSAVSHTYLNAGMYYVCISVGTPGTTNYCTYCNAVQIGNPTSFCTISYYADPLNPNTYVFTSSSSSSSSMIAWDFGDNTAGSGQSVSHAYNSAGPFTVCVTERDLLQNIVCQSCVTINPNGGTTGCQASYLATSLGLDGYFVDMSSSNSPTMTYSWDFGDGQTSNLEFPQHHFTLPGLYNVCLTIADSNCNDTYCSAVLIDTISLNNPGHGCNAFYAFIQMNPFVVTVVNLSSGYNLTFDWDFGDGTHDSNPYPSHFYTSTGSYSLCLTVADANGCSSTYCDTINVDSLGHIFRVGSSGFTLNVVSPAQLTGVSEVTTDKSFSIYPNPFNSQIRISMLTGSKTATDYRILSIQGAEVSRGKLEGSNGVIDTQALSSGAYLLEIKMNDGSRGFQRVIKN
jgi:PKD repeat protein